MNNLKKQQKGLGLRKVLVVFVLFGYTLSTVLAFDTNNKDWGSTAGEPMDNTIDTPSLHSQIESDVAFGVKKIWNNLVDFMQDGISTGKQEINNAFFSENTKTSEKTNNNQPLIRINFSNSETTLLPAFEDISDDPQKQDIEVLASIGLLQGDGNGKFHPKNHVRYSDFVRLIVDIYRYQLGYSLESTDGLTNKKLLSLKDPNSILAKKLNTAEELGILEGVDSLKRDQIITPLQAKKIIKNTLALRLDFGQGDKVELIDTTKSVLTKSEMVGYLAEIFQLKFSQKESVFSDIDNHQYRSAITKLAQLGVVAGRNGKFYPDNYALRADGIIMIANSIIANERKALIINDFYHLNTITDVTYFATYAPHLEFLLEHEIGDSLLHSTQSGNLFLPDAVLTQGEAYSLVAKAAGIKILNPDSGTATKPITRGELANLLVEAFDFSPNSTEKGLETTTLNNKDYQNKSSTKDARKSLFVSILQDVIDELG